MLRRFPTRSLSLSGGLLALFLLPGSALAQEPGVDVRPSLAIVGVDVVPIEPEGVQREQTVLVRDGRILAVGPAGEVEIPDGSIRIDGRGRTLVPGVAEMHGHYPDPEQEALTRSILFLYVANGVTLVRGMQGNESHLPLRDAIARGEILGPRLLVSAPAMSGQTVQDPARAEALVREYHEAGFDHLKVHEGLSLEVYDAIARTAKEVGLTFSGHVSNQVGLEHALEAGQTTIDHLDNFLEAMVSDREAVRTAGLFDLPKLVSSLDESRFAEVVAMTREAGAGVVPTEALWETFLGERNGAEMLAARPEVEYMPASMVEQWRRAVDQRSEALGSPEAGRRVIELRRRLIRELHDGGVPVLLGTDSPQIFSVPGFSIHREMQVMVASGLTPYEVLRSGTLAVARFYGAEEDFGSITPGRRADLVLLEANPLDDIANFARIAGVVVAGRWLGRETLDERLAEIEDGVGAGVE